MSLRALVLSCPPGLTDAGCAAWCNEAEQLPTVVAASEVRKVLTLHGKWLPLNAAAATSTVAASVVEVLKPGMFEEFDCTQPSVLAMYVSLAEALLASNLIDLQTKINLLALATRPISRAQARGIPPVAEADAHAVRLRQAAQVHLQSLASLEDGVAAKALEALVGELVTDSQVRAWRMGA